MSFANNYCQFKHQRCVININFLEQIFWSSWLIFLKATRSVSSRVKDIVICNDYALPLLYRLFRNGICIEFGTDLERIWIEWEAEDKRRQLDEKKHSTYGWIYLINREKQNFLMILACFSENLCIFAPTLNEKLKMKN